jgi:quercetin dioxygenase-like cupin family protein
VQILDINKLIEFDDRRFRRKVLVNERESRLVLLCLRAGQQVPEHSTTGPVNVLAFSGHVTFYDGAEPCEMSAGMLVRVEANHLHRVIAHQDSVLLVTLIRSAETAISQSAQAQS